MSRRFDAKNSDVALRSLIGSISSTATVVARARATTPTPDAVISAVANRAYTKGNTLVVDPAGTSSTDHDEEEAEDAQGDNGFGSSRSVRHCDD